MEQPSFQLHDIYRALSVIAEESDYIQSRLFKNSTAIQKRNTQVIYYDCTNFYFETDAAEDDKQFGKSKENRPLPIVGMGLFMDMDGIPISFSIYPGSRNGQMTMIPLEEKMLSRFDMSKFIVCTDAGLSSATNRVFNSYDGDEAGKKYKISELDDEKDKNKIFYKTRWIKEEGPVHTDNGDKKEITEQKLIVPYSIKYRSFQRHIREGQIERAKKLVEEGYTSAGKKKQNDPKRFIKTDHATKDGEIAEISASCIGQSVIGDGEKYDGFYAVCTDLDGNISSIVKANRRRWEIEECFRIMKTDFEARPVYTRTELTDALHEAFGFCTSKQIVPIAKMRNIFSQTKKQMRNVHS